MSKGLPKLRDDLEWREQTSAGGTVYIVKDPDGAEFFRLQEAEKFIAAQLDGETELEAIQRRVEEKFGASLPRDDLAAFVKTLERNGLLESARSTRARNRRKHGRLAGGPLYLRFKLIDPEPLLERLIGPLRFFFTRTFMRLSAGVIATAIGVAIFNWSAIVDDAASLYDIWTLPLLFATIFIIVSLHEFAHALACKHFGGQVREMGFMLLYFQPALYCNVSDAWLFPEKYKRLLVGFAGPYFELFIWALATLAWRVTDPGTAINDVALVALATSGIKTLFNFNPLIKLDGYYLLSDYLEIPNLRRKSFAYVGNLLRRIGGRHGAAPSSAISRREKRVYLTYGVTAWLFSVSLLSYIGLVVGEYLIIEGQRVAFFAMTGLIGFRFRDKFRNLFRRRSSKDGRSTGDDKSSRGRKRRFAFFKRWTLRLALASALGVLLFEGHMQLRVAGPINVLPHHNADVRAEIEGVIAEIHVTEGQIVAKGDLIAQLSDREHRAELKKTEAEIRQMEAKLEMLMVGPRPEEIDVAQSAVAKAEDLLRFAQAKRARNEALFDQQLVSRNDFDATRELESTALNELAEARTKLEVLLAGTRPEEIEAGRAELARLEAQRRYLEEQLERSNVLSPAAGVVTTPSRHLRAMVRQLVPKGGLIAKVHELETLTVEAIISEKEIADVAVGQTVAIKARAYPDRIFSGKVVEIGTTTLGSPAGEAGSSAGGADATGPGAADKAGTGIRVTTEIDNSSGLLKPGMTGMAKIYCGERRLIDLVLRRLSRTFRVEFWSWW